MLTMYALSHGASEFNPIVASMIGQGIAWFLFYKLIFVNSMILFVGFFSQKYSISKMGLGVASWVYSLLIFWHLANLSTLFKTGSEL